MDEDRDKMRYAAINRLVFDIWCILYTAIHYDKYTRRSSRRWKRVSHFGYINTLPLSPYCTAWLINGVTNPSQKNYDVMQRKGAHFVMWRSVDLYLFRMELLTTRFYLFSFFFFFTRCAANRAAFFPRESLPRGGFVFLEIMNEDSLLCNKLLFIENKYAVRLSGKEGIMPIGTDRICVIHSAANEQLQLMRFLCGVTHVISRE